MLDFEAIRPFRDEEINAKMVEMTTNPDVLAFFPKIFPNTSIEDMVKILRSIHSVHDFQEKISGPFLYNLEKTTSSGVSFLGSEYLDKSKGYLFISNHRDIVLDPALLNSGLLKNKLPMTEIAIGDNLFVYSWIKDIVRVNRSFIVQRSAPIRQMLENSKRLSAYIRHTLTERNQSVWIAQREGRSKNSDDRTQEALLKMLNMSGGKSFVENAMALNFCPLSISYEFDPCDYLKAQEFQLKRDNPEYTKTPADDLINMGTGIQGFKGNISFQICGTLNDEIAKIDTSNGLAPQLTELALLIDKHIHRNYAIYSGNKVAYDLYLNTTRFQNEYDLKEKASFETYLMQQISKINIPNKDEEYLRDCILQMYANPLINKLKAQGEE